MDPQPRAHIYVDDGHPEASEYDSNYVALPASEPRHWLAVLFRLRTARALEAAAATDASRAGQHPTGAGDQDQRWRA